MEKIMAGMTHLSLHQLKKDVVMIIPGATVKRDEHGQLVIYTGMQADDKGKLYAWTSTETNNG